MDAVADLQTPNIEQSHAMLTRLGQTVKWTNHLHCQLGGYHQPAHCTACSDLQMLELLAL